MNRYLTSTHEIADALQTIADDLRLLHDANVAETHVTVYVQAHASYGTPEERMRSVDLLGWLTAGATGFVEEDGQYRTPYGSGSRPGVDVRVFTSPGAAKDGTR